MAEVVIYSAVKKIGVALGNEAINQASSELKRFMTQLRALQGSMGRIKRELRLMHEFLCQVDVRNRKNRTYEMWMQELRILAHGIEDNVDEYMHLVGQKHDAGWCTYFKKGVKQPNLLLSLNKIASLIKEAEANLLHLFQAKDRWVTMTYGGNSSESSYIVERFQELANVSRSLDEDLVGPVDEITRKLEQLLVGDSLKRSMKVFERCLAYWRGTVSTSTSIDVGRHVIVLHGMGGLGKTALAAKVYRKEREKFQCHAWISVSQTYSREDVLRNIVKELLKHEVDPPNTATMDMTRLKDTLREFLGARKYLIILDDVWTREVFYDLSSMLIDNNNGSKLIITTREGDVALASQGYTLRLEVLPEDKAWDLFCKKAFPRDTNHECPAELKTLSGEILSKCKGLPLAIVSVGSLLCVCEKTLQEWRRINDQLGWELINNSRLYHIRNVLHLSFIYLPTYFKSCFLYCSLFQEDYIFHRKKIVRLWVAEGFIEERGASTIEEVAEGYLKELVDRNMLQLVGRNTFGRMKKFRMHDILRELAVDLCQKDCFGVTYEEDRCWGSVHTDERRLVVHKLKTDIQEAFSSIHRLRTFITLDSSMPSFNVIPLLSEKSKFITVVELSGLPIERIPDAIGYLFNLRYLGLRDSRVKLLPKSIEKLINLLTLDLASSDIQELPAGIVKLKKLRHLFAEKVNDPFGKVLSSRSGVCIKGLSNMTNLLTLQTLEVDDESIGQLGKLRQLRSLRIRNVKEINCGRLCESLVQMKFLSYLCVCANDLNEVLRLEALPPSLQKLRLKGKLAEETLLGDSRLIEAVKQNLYSLFLDWSNLREDPLRSLSQLCNLNVLELYRAYNGEKLVFLTGWFPSLKFLLLGYLPNLRQVDIEQGTMTTLQGLTLVNLKKMMSVPRGIEYLLTLQYANFYKITPAYFRILVDCSRLRGMRWGFTPQDQD